jgi:hypothetical protein
MAGDVNLCDELKFDRQAEGKLVIYRGDVDEGFGDDGIPKLCDELKFDRQAEEKLVIYRGDDNDLEEGFGEDGIPKSQLQTLETDGTDDDHGKMDLYEEGTDIVPLAGKNQILPSS